MSICESETASGEPTPDYVTQRQRQNRDRNESLDEGDPGDGALSSNITSSQLAEFRIEMRQLITYFTKNQTAELREISATMKEIKHTNENIEASIADLTKQNEDFSKRFDQIEKQLKEDNDYIVFLENKLEESQMSNRKSNIEIKNVPSKKNETKADLLAMVTSLATNLECSISKSDIKDIYRVRVKGENKSMPIILETNSALLKLELIKAAKAYNRKNPSRLCARHLGFTYNEDQQIYLSEHLTAKGSRLYFLARDLKKSKGYKHCWTSYGKVYVRKTDESQIIQINSEEQVQRLFQD
ncbi:uncharacterized protein LOC125230872 [Leguminivora glycinivorella]|uniref:uncharacterized protein LOC125230872 n=1 Tax=Leguminivora glycinivorella TaxID=1035111 RepID=UPI00200F0332|nr:uncharacterized protein LOC125230872 [Leguminivora glycinivorella]